MLAPQGVARLQRRLAGRRLANQKAIPPSSASPSSSRPTIAERCAALNFRLTQKRRQVIAAFDQMDTPFALEDAYLHCRGLGLEVNRSSIFRLISDLVEARVLTLVGADHRRALYGVPLPVELVIEAAGRPRARIDDPVLVAMLVAAAARLGVEVVSGQILVSIGERGESRS